MFKEYFEEEIEIMPNFLKSKYMRSIKSLLKQERFKDRETAVKNIFEEGVGSEKTLLRILKEHEELLIAAYCEIEASKSLKYSALFELDDERSSDEIIELIATGDSLLNSTNKLNGTSLKATKLKNLLKFTFLLDGIKIRNQKSRAVKTTYSVTVKFWEIKDENKRFVEIDADNVASYFRLDKTNFFEEMIDMVYEYLQTEFSLVLIPIDLMHTLEEIKDKEKKGELHNLPKASAQKMVLSSGSQAILDSNDAETIILPILGELKKLIEENEELFSNCLDAKILIENFIRDTEVTADLPWITFTWDNVIKSKKIQVKFVLSEYPYTLLNYYSHSKGRSGMDDVVESLLQEYCNKQNNKKEEYQFERAE